MPSSTSTTLSSALPKVIPAQLGYLAIYNPSLGPTEETFSSQLLFYYSRSTYDSHHLSKKSGRNERAGGDELKREEGERLRRIGLIQGMIGFAQTFSKGEPIDAIETEKTRAVVAQLDEGWWIVASIDLTQIPHTKASGKSGGDGKGKGKAKGGKNETEMEMEFSAREVSPPALLLEQIRQAQRVFALHHGPSLSEVYSRLGRGKFTNVLERFWLRFCRTWNVLLHGNPAADLLGGVKLASGGELGFGVGEEEWGSGEREVLEDLVRKTDGMIDIFVSRFGEPAKAVSNTVLVNEEDALPWMGSGNEPIATDGVIFGGTGTLARSSVRDIMLWIRQIYKYGDRAYGVKDHPSRERRKKRRRVDGTSVKESVAEGVSSGQASNKSIHSSKTSGRTDKADQVEAVQTRDFATPTGNESQSAAIPPPIITATDTSSTIEQGDTLVGPEDSDKQTDEAGTTLGIPDQYMKYLTLGLSTLAKPSMTKRPSLASRKTSSISQRSRISASEEGPTILTDLNPIPDGESMEAKIVMQKQRENRGHFIVGLRGNLDEIPDDADSDEIVERMQEDDDGTRVILRTINVELIPTFIFNDASSAPNSLVSKPDSRPSVETLASSSTITSSKKFQRVRVLIYVKRPFIFCMLFESRTSSLGYARFYKSLHRNLDPIHRPLLSSTDINKIAQRIHASHTDATSSINQAHTGSAAGIYELIYDPKTITLHSSIPNIAEPGTPAAEGLTISTSSTAKSGSKSLTARPSGSDWTRLDALNVHHQVLNTVVNTRRKAGEGLMEVTSKTSRGWWIVWMRMTPDKSRPNREADLMSDDEVDHGSEAREEGDGRDKGKDTNGKDSVPKQPSLRRAPHSNDSNVTMVNLNTLQSSQPRRSQKSIINSYRARTDQAEVATEEIPPDFQPIAFVVRKASDSTSAYPSSSSPGPYSGYMSPLSPTISTMSVVQPSSPTKPQSRAQSILEIAHNERYTSPTKTRAASVRTASVSRGGGLTGGYGGGLAGGYGAGAALRGAGSLLGSIPIPGFSAFRSSPSSPSSSAKTLIPSSSTISIVQPTSDTLPNVSHPVDQAGPHTSSTFPDQEAGVEMDQDQGEMRRGREDAVGKLQTFANQHGKGEIYGRSPSLMSRSQSIASRSGSVVGRRRSITPSIFSTNTITNNNHAMSVNEEMESRLTDHGAGEANVGGIGFDARGYIQGLMSLLR